MKKVIIIAAASIINFSAFAQNQANQTSTASQTTNLVLSNAIEITFVGTGNAVGADVNIPFNNVNDYANGVESDLQLLRVRSNKDFSITVKSNSESFSYNGKTSPAPKMPVKGVLAVQVPKNGTGGTVSGDFENYGTLASSDQKLIKDADKGGNQEFYVQYKATPGFAYPAGVYSVDVVYTATQQ